MFENDSAGSLVRKMAPRIVMAALKGLLYFVLFYFLPLLFVSQLSAFAPDLLAGHEQLLTAFVGVVIFFAVAGELTSGTIYQHAFNIGKAIILIIYFVLALNGGIVTLSMNLEQIPINFWADLRIFLIALVTIDLLGLAKSILEAINFLSEKAEKQLQVLKPSV